LSIQQHQQQPGRTSSGGGGSVSRLPTPAADVGRDTLRSAADAAWQPEMNYDRYMFRARPIPPQDGTKITEKRRVER